MLKISQKLRFWYEFGLKTEKELDHGVWSRSFNEYCAYCSIELEFFSELSLSGTKKN